MPELPEVESLRLSLLPYLLDKKVLKTEVREPKVVSGKGTARKANLLLAEQFANTLDGKTLSKINRRAKNLIFEFADSSRLLVHLKMTGQLVFQPFESDKQGLISGGHPIELSENKLPNKHTHVIFRFAHGNLYYNDVRKFGYLLHYANVEEFQSEEHFKDLGSEPLGKDFTLEVFSKALRSKKGTLKKVFLDQKVVVGLGNIYSDEVCFVAKVRPDRAIGSLKKPEIKRLYEAIRKIIPRAVELGGSSVANYLLADGSRGNYAREHYVYNRGGKECRVCGTTLEKKQVAGRTTVYCPNCQK
jgi:formamidopyrimidine-DNA glycosylase